MGKFTKKLIAILLCLVMIGTWLPVGAFAADEQTAYTLYPTPHTIVYDGGSFALKDFNVLYGTGVDDATKARLDEVAALRGLSVTDATEAAADKTNVYVAIYGSGDAVESYILANYTVDAALFEKTDANFVAAKDGEIVVLGKDTDSCFYGLTTIYQIFGQLTANTLLNLTINDYADVASRGFIEGYYGNPWSTQDRINLMTWGGYYKLNSYFYAPKDDPKHNAKWRELYTAEEIETLIKPLADAGNASKCRFVYALHPYMYNPITDSNYDDSMAVLKAKFTQVIEAGVRQIAILADDAGNQGGTHYTKMLTDMTAWIQEMQETYPDLKLLLPFVTQEYMYFGQSYYQNFPENIQIVMTGGQVWGFCSPSFTNTFYNNVGRGVYLWINWPCTDNSKNHLIMGGYADFLQPGVDPAKVEGIVLNPMQQSEPSKVAIFGNACYTWNMWETEEEADAAWEVAFACVDHNTVVPNDASNALKELSKHMIDQTRFEDNDQVLEESVVLREELSAFRSKLNAGTYTQEDIDSLVEEFTILQNAAKVYREQGNDDIVAQIEPWLGNWDDTTVSILSYLDALSAILNNEGDDAVWSSYAAGQAAYESSRNHPLWYMDHYEYAESGYRFIVPFMRALDAYLAEKVATIVDPNAQTVAYITNREDSPATGSVANITDGNDSTSAIYKTPNAIVTGDYVGLMFSTATDIRTIHIVLGAGKDHFDQGKLEYTLDGTNWYDLPLTGMENSFTGVQNQAQVVDVSQENLPTGFQAKGIRFIATADNAADAWLEVREVAVNYEPGEAGEALSLTAFEGNAPGYYSGSLANMVDGNTSTFGWYNDYGRVGQYVGVDLGSVVKVGQVTFTQDSGDHFSNYSLQYSTDGVNYTTYANYSDAVLNVNLASDNIEARYIRFYNNAVTSVWIKIYEMAVSAASDSTVMTNSAALADLKNRVVDGTAVLVSTGSVTLNPGDYIGHDLARIKELDSIAVDAQDALTLQVSPNMVDWTTVTAGDVDADARYVRLINLTDAAVTTDLNTFTVTYNEHTGPYLYESTMGINSSWGVSEDCRENGAAFDGDVTTMTEFGDLPQQGQYIIYDLSRSREISKLEIYCIDSALNYIRDAEMQISNDLTNWTTVLTIGDGVQNTDDASVTCINSDAGYSQATSTYPNYVSIEGEVEPQMARYIRILMTATNNNRAVVFYEIEVNGGEFLSASHDPAFESTAVEVYGYAPQNMVDGNLTTSWKPDTTEAGSMVYTFSDNLEANRINIAQKAVSNARISIYAENDGVRSWIDMGTLDKSLVKLTCDNDLNLALKIEWDANAAPNITEIVRYSEVTEEPSHTHTPGAEVRENEVPATCTEDGSYDSVVCCTECGEEISRWTFTIPATGHHYEDGTCTVCGAEDETGVVRVDLTVGETATYTDDTGYYVDADTSALDQNVATVTLTGTAANEYTLGEKVTAIESGSQYLIVNTRASKTLTNASASAAAAAGAGSGLSLNGTTASIAAAAIWTIEGADGTYTVKDGNGNYLTIASNSASVSATAANLGLAYGGTTWTINQSGAYLNDFGALGNCAAGWQDSAAAADAGSQWDLYKVNTVSSGTTITFTAVGAGETSVQIGDITYKITVTGQAHTHTPGEEVRENEVPATCTEDGSYESVISCTGCGEEISRTTVTVPATGHNHVNGTCACGDTLGVAYITATETVYDNVADALKAAEAGQTVYVLRDHAVANVLVTPGVILDLNGHALTATFVVGFNNAHIVDNVGSGRLNVAAQNVVLDAENNAIPVYDGAGFIFTKAGFAIRQDAEWSDGFKIDAVAYPVNTAVAELLKDGGADNKVQVAIILTWDTADGTGSQRFVFTDEVISQVYSSHNGEEYTKMFSMVVTGFENIQNLTARIAMVSDTNVQYVSSQSVTIE